MRQYITSPQITAEQMKQKRKELGLTQKEFAEFIGVSKPTVERWEVSDKPITGPVARFLQLVTPSHVTNLEVPEKTLPIRMWYMYKDKICTLIDADETKRIVRIRNYVKNLQFVAFGVNLEPTFDDYEEFLRSRCFPESRDKMKLILKDLNLPFYDPFLIVEKTEGRMAEDDFWIKVEK